MSSFAENVFKLLTGNVVAHGLVLIVTPILTRLFAPDAFGVAALFASIASILGAVSCLRYELAIMLPKDDGEAANLLSVSVCFVSIVSMITAFLIYLSDDVILHMLNFPQLKSYLWLIPLAVFATGITLPFRYWQSRNRKFGRISIAQILSSGTSQTSKLIAGVSGYVTGGAIIWGNLLGLMIQFAFLGGRIWQDDRHLFRSSVRWERMIASMRRHKRFPLFSTWSALLNTASTHLPAVILAIYFSPTVVGFFAIGRAALGLPLSLLGRSVAEVFYQKASDVKSHSGDLAKVVEAVFIRLTAFGMFPILMLMVIGKDLFVVVFGAPWSEAGIYVQILAIWIFFQFISSPISMLFSVLEKQRFGLIFNLLLFATRFGSIILGGMTGNIKLTLLLFANTGAACYCILSLWLLSQAGIPVKRAVSQWVKYGFYSCPLLMTILLAKWRLGIHGVTVLLLGLCCLIIYYLYVISKDKELKIFVTAHLHRRHGISRKRHDS